MTTATERKRTITRLPFFAPSMTLPAPRAALWPALVPMRPRSSAVSAPARQPCRRSLAYSYRLPLFPQFLFDCLDDMALIDCAFRMADFHDKPVETAVDVLNEHAPVSSGCHWQIVREDAFRFTRSSPNSVQSS